MKTNIIHIKGFNTVFTLKVKRSSFMSIAEAEEYAKKEITDTCEIIKVDHLINGRVTEVLNKNYKEPKIFSMNPSQYQKLRA